LSRLCSAAPSTRSRRARLEQSALLPDLARQVQDIASAVEALRVRVTQALLASGLAAALAILAVALSLWRTR
jgi:hypothetical protein